VTLSARWPGSCFGFAVMSPLGPPVPHMHHSGTNVGFAALTCVRPPPHPKPPRWLPDTSRGAASRAQHNKKSCALSSCGPPLHEPAAGPGHRPVWAPPLSWTERAKNRAAVRVPNLLSRCLFRLFGSTFVRSCSAAWGLVWGGQCFVEVLDRPTGIHLVQSLKCPSRIVQRVNGGPNAIQLVLF
jgi:hypothetical protein